MKLKFAKIIVALVAVVMPLIAVAPAHATGQDPFACPVKPVLSMNSTGVCVKNLQWHLKNSGSVSFAARQALKINGYFDWPTKSALIYYQLDPNHRGLGNKPLGQSAANIGVANLNTWCAIYRTQGKSCASLTQPVNNAAYYAQLILQNPHISIQPQTVGIMQRVARGECAPVEATGQCVRVSADLLKLVNDMANRGIPIVIAYLTNGHHVTNSFHYRGLAVDIANQEQHVSIMPYVFNHRAEYHVDELIYWNSPLNLDQGVPHHYDPATEADHRDHIHIAVDVY